VADEAGDFSFWEGPPGCVQTAGLFLLTHLEPLPGSRLWSR